MQTFQIIFLPTGTRDGSSLVCQKFITSQNAFLLVSFPKEVYTVIFCSTKEVALLSWLET